MKKHIPNILTCLNVICGTVAIIEAAAFERLYIAAIFILVGMVFDFLDGFCARLLNCSSPIGKELDSLADICTFGVAPAVCAFMLLDSAGAIYMRYIVVLIPALSAYRLAKFNLDERQKENFIGLPTPANALFWVTLILGAVWAPGLYITLFNHTTVLVIAVVILSILLVTEIPMFSLKVKSLKWSENRVRYIYFIIAILFLVVAGILCESFKGGLGAVMLLVPLYILVCLIALLAQKLSKKSA